jgi:hypothetical protein
MLGVVVAVELHVLFRLRGRECCRNWLDVDAADFDC